MIFVEKSNIMYHLRGAEMIFVEKCNIMYCLEGRQEPSSRSPAQCNGSRGDMDLRREVQHNVLPRGKFYI